MVWFQGGKHCNTMETYTPAGNVVAESFNQITMCNISLCSPISYHYNLTIMLKDFFVKTIFHKKFGKKYNHLRHEMLTTYISNFADTCIFRFFFLQFNLSVGL